MNQQMRLACVSFSHLALILAWRDHPELTSEAVLVGSCSRDGRGIVLAASAAAQAMGAHIGQDLRQAELACPEAVRLRADPIRMDQLREQLRAALYECSPLVELTTDSQVYLDLGGRDARWATEAARSAHLGRSVQQVLGVPPSVGVGQSRFVALVASSKAGPGRVRRVPYGAVADFLSDWPVSMLPLPPRTVERLQGFGLQSCGDCISIPLPDLQRQLGADGLTLHRLCLGQDSALISPWREAPPCGVRRVLAGVVEDSESLRFGAAELAERLAAKLSCRGRASGRLRLLLLDEDAAEGVVTAAQPGVFWDEIEPPAPVATAEELLPPILSLFARARCRALVIEIHALDLTQPPATQSPLWAVGGARSADIGRAAARLAQRFGPELVWRVEVRAGHPGDIPEERLVWSPG